MLARKQELNTQLQQLIDAFLLAVSLWVAYVVRFTSHPGSILQTCSIHSGTIVVIMPFGPIMVDLQGCARRDHIVRSSFGLDLKTLLRPIPAVITGSGAK